MNQRAYQQLDPVRSKTPETSADALAHRTSNGVDPKAIEALKAARDQVIQADKGPLRSRESEASGSAVKNMTGGQNPSPKQAPPNKFAPLEARPKSAVDITGVLPLTGFAEEFVQKLASIEQEKAAIDEEMAKTEKLWSSLVEKKKQLEARRIEFTKVEDRLKELNKEMNDVLKHFILF